MKKYTEIVDILRSVRNHPSIYLGEVEPHLLDCFLNGFYSCYGIFANDREEHAEVRKKILESRGWTGAILWSEMEREGLSSEKCVDEMLDVEIETWRRLGGAHCP